MPLLCLSYLCCIWASKSVICLCIFPTLSLFPTLSSQSLFCTFQAVVVLHLPFISICPTQIIMLVTALLYLVLCWSTCQIDLHIYLGFIWCRAILNILLMIPLREEYSSIWKMWRIRVECETYANSQRTLRSLQALRLAW